ncbi:MAG: FAD-binding oxidoreductase [Dehalococcoidia bacterium]|nr:FAD-binding oxidoreductase [Dehalococcoidia bacterium]
MALRRDVYRLFENVVGPENISDEPAVLQSYMYQPFGSKEGVWAEISPEAVILPGKAEEVVAIAKICNRYGIVFKPMSTGWGLHNLPGVQGAVSLDLRRMNRILEIDEKNMFAVVEPHVICMQLQVEAMKRGLNCHIIGAGSNTSVLASATSVVGYGPDGLSMGFSGRNLLGVEWVLPTGDVLKLGSLGADAGWFCGDGPGPSLRGIMRGWEGAWGGLGVFTKCAVKLFHWNGPPTLEMKRTPPNYVLKEPIKYMKVALFSFPTIEKLAEAALQLGEAEIGWFISRLSPSFVGLQMAAGANYVATWNTGMLQEMLKYAFLFVIFANSEGEFEYQQKVLDQILQDTGGQISPISETKEMQELTATAVIKVDEVTRSCFRTTGGFNTSFGAMDTVDLAMNQIKVGSELKNKYIGRGVIMDDGGDNSATLVFDQGHMAYTEMLLMYDPHDHESAEGAFQYLTESNQAMLDKKLGTPIFQVSQVGQGKHGMFGAACYNYDKWLRKIKKEFDLNNACDPTAYAPPEA